MKPVDIPPHSGLVFHVTGTAVGNSDMTEFLYYCGNWFTPQIFVRTVYGSITTCIDDKKTAPAGAFAC